MVQILDSMAEGDFEQVIAFQNRATGLRGFLAIHDTTLGPALGGVRIWTYPSEADALTDALRLARAMTYKASLAGLPCGGGKSVILVHPGLHRAAALEEFGALIEGLRGRYFCARDVGVTDEDLKSIARSTRRVALEPSAELGDISRHTAQGVWQGMRACLNFAGLRRARVAIQGVGSVGMWLARILESEGMELVVADVDPARAQAAARELSARVLPAEEILAADCDVLAPCALGGVLDEQSTLAIRAQIVCGAANNVLSSSEAGDLLHRRGILYAPDYLVNAGGLIRGAEFFLLGRRDSQLSVGKIYDRMRNLLELARTRGVSTARLADELAEARLKKDKTHSDLYWGTGRPRERVASRPGRRR